MRALVRAQLLEEGYEVKAWPSPDPAMAHLLRGGEQPLLTIFDAEGSAVEVQTLSDLWQATGRAPLILCGGTLSRSFLAEEGLPPALVLMRPVRVGDLVDAVRTVLGGRAT